MLTIMLSTLIVSLLLASSPARQAPTFTWDQLKGVYDYGGFSVDSVKSTDRMAPEGTYTEFTFPSENGSTAYGTFARPNAKGPFPLIILIHGLGGSRAEMIKQFATDFLKAGDAVLALDAPHHGDRATDEDHKQFNSIVLGFAMSKDQADGLSAYMFKNDPEGKNAKLGLDAIEQGVRDYRRALDWVKMPEHRVDASKVGALGVSLGSIMASILSGVDPRIDADLLVIGGDPIYPLISSLPADKQLLGGAAASASLYLGHSTAHVFMMNGYNDQVIPRKDELRLFESAPGSRIMFFDTPSDIEHQLGHSITQEGYAIGEAWLEKMVSVPKPLERFPLKPAAAG